MAEISMNNILEEKILFISDESWSYFRNIWLHDKSTLTETAYKEINHYFLNVTLSKHTDYCEHYSQLVDITGPDEVDIHDLLLTCMSMNKFETDTKQISDALDALELI